MLTVFISLSQLFYLVANSYQTHCKGVELLKQRGKDICWTFIADHAPLQLKLEETVKHRICELGGHLYDSSCYEDVHSAVIYDVCVL